VRRSGDLSEMQVGEREEAGERERASTMPTKWDGEVDTERKETEMMKWKDEMDRCD